MQSPARSVREPALLLARSSAYNYLCVGVVWALFNVLFVSDLPSLQLLLRGKCWDGTDRLLPYQDAVCNVNTTPTLISVYIRIFLYISV